MKVTLLHKLSAGDGHHTRDQLVGLFEGHGHTVSYLTTDDDWRTALEAPADLVAVAGGDGTVQKVVMQLKGLDRPLAILPVGTANNIAHRLGLGGELEEIVSRLAEAKRRPLDMGVVRGPWGEQHFADCVGLGAFTRMMAFVKREQGELVPDPSEPEASLHRDLRLLQTFLHDFDAHYCTLTLDGETEAVPYLLLEVTNTGLIGPQVELAPEADCGDGLFEIVIVGEAERQQMGEYLEARLAGEERAVLTLPVRQARRVQLTIEADRVHIDGDLWPEVEEPPPAAGAPVEVEVWVEPGVVEVLVPSCLNSSTSGSGWTRRRR